MSVTDWEGTRTVTGFPFQSRVWYVVLAPSTDTIVATGALALGCGGADRSAQPSDVTAQRQATVTTRGRAEW
jgi:chitodextrinase